MINDRELLELAAKAAGYAGWDFLAGEDGNLMNVYKDDGSHDVWWPLEDDGDALRLAVKLHIEISMHPEHDTVICEPKDDPASIITTEALDDYGVRRAIVRAAAEIGRAMP